MKKFTDHLRGFYRLEITGGSPQWCLNRLIAVSVPFWDVVWADEFTVCFSVYRCDLAQARRQAADSMCCVQRVTQHGLYHRYRGILRRRCFLAMIVIALLCALILPRFLWFYEVEGNETVPTERIIRAANESGAGIGTYGRSIKPHLVREKVLARIPELSWLTVTQSGGRAKIVVREKRLPKNIVDRRAPQNIVASHSGMVTEISVLEGSPAVKKGDMVQEGQLLISGYMDLEYKYRVCGADGEIYGRTWRNFYGITPDMCTEKAFTGEEKRRTYLEVGGKRIKLSLGSGIFPTGCDKMTKRTVLTLPGGLSLPVALVCEHYRFYEQQSVSVPESVAEQMLLLAANAEVKSEMIAGTVRQETHSLFRENGNFSIRATLECEEMISRAQNAEIFKGESKHDGTSDKR